MDIFKAVVTGKELNKNPIKTQNKPNKLDNDQKQKSYKLTPQEIAAQKRENKRKHRQRLKQLENKKRKGSTNAFLTFTAG